MAGGKAVEIIAKQVENKTNIEFPVPMRMYRDCRFSFAGVKASIFDHINREKTKTDIDCDQMVPNIGDYSDNTNK